MPDPVYLLTGEAQAVRDALEHAVQVCPYHGADFAAAGVAPVSGIPRCDSCKQPWRIRRALKALNEGLE